MRHLCESGLRENRTGRLSGGRRLALRGASSDPTALKGANNGRKSLRSPWSQGPGSRGDWTDPARTDLSVGLFRVTRIRPEAGTRQGVRHNS